MFPEIDMFKKDLEKYYRIGNGEKRVPLLKKLQGWILNFGLHCVFVYRFGHFAARLYNKNLFLGLLPKIEGTFSSIKIDNLLC